MKRKRSVNELALWVGITVLVSWGCSLLATPAPLYFPTPDVTLTNVYSNVEPSPTSRILPLMTPTVGPEVQTSTPTATSTLIEASPTVSSTVVAQNLRGKEPIVATYLTLPPVIDGDLREWENPGYGIRYLVWGSANWSGEKDCSGTAQAGWDEGNLYLAVQVSDDVYSQPDSGAYLYRGDSLEIVLDTNLEADFYDRKLSSDDYQLGISPGSPVGTGTEAYLWFPLAKEGHYAVETEARAVSDGYQVEIRIPWILFNMKPESGKYYGFAISISDDDLAGIAAQQSMVSLASNRHLTDPTTWVDLLLSKP